MAAHLARRLAAAMLLLALAACGGGGGGDEPPPPPGNATLTVAVTGSGQVASTPAGIDCGADCSESYAQGTVVSLQATAAAGWAFSGWSGGCGNAATCTVTVAAATNVTATFTQVLFPLNVSVTGSGTVQSTPAGINCPADCSESYAQATAVTLTALPAAGQQFDGWSGAGCSGTGTCVVTLNAAASVTAAFSTTPPNQHSLNVVVSGSGSVASTPAGITCPTDCSQSYAQGTSVTLTATPASGASFTGWSGGGCSGTGTCTVAMNATTSVTASFSQNTQTLTVTRTGQGTISSSPAGIACGADCNESYAQGTVVALTATPSTNWAFTGWGGACSGTGACSVTMNSAVNVSATFTQPMHMLTVTRAGAGTGTVTSSPAGVNCGSDCTESYAQGTVVALTATPGTNSTFSGWSGACSGTGACSVTMAAARTVTATFATSSALGLTSRPNNTSCFAFDPPPTSTASLTLQAVFASLPAFNKPVAMLQAPNDSTRWFVVEKGGVVRVFTNSGAASTSSVFIDVSTLLAASPEEEAGLLGMAFDPNFGSGAGKNRFVYLFYSGAPNSGYRLRSTISRFTANDALTTADRSTEVKLITLDKFETNHNGGNIAFGPDGYLYAGFGDGGGAPNPEAQDDRFLFGKIIRINPAATTGAVPYAIPADNPNAGGPLCNATGRGTSACAEVWARGLRNPWRWSFDRVSGRLWVGDVGWGSYEEVNIVTRNANYGWPITEGPSCVTAGCNKAGLTDPVHSVARGDGQAITGGYVYRGTQSTDMLGHYVYGDFGSRMFGAVIAGSTPGSYTARTLIAPFSSSSIMVSSFGQASDGELFALDYSSGRIRQLIFSSGSGSGGPVVPTLLSATGCVSASDPRQPATGLVNYDINAPFWSDGAVKERFFALPAAPASFAAGSDGDWTMAPRGVLMKNFRLGSTLIETRLLMRQSNGDWAGYSYEWNDAQTDATLVGAAGKDKAIAGQTWAYPSRSQCLQCHTTAAGFSLGLETQQMNRNTTYAQTGINAHQLTTLSSTPVGMLTPQVTDPSALPKLADPFGSEAVATRARAYLHTNCAMCHRPGGPTPVSLNLLAATALSATNTCNVDPTRGTMGLPNAKIIAPGAPDSSVLLARMATRDSTLQMPPIGSHVADSAGVGLIRGWITSLTNCN